MRILAKSLAASAVFALVLGSGSAAVAAKAIPKGSAIPKVEKTAIPKTAIPKDGHSQERRHSQGSAIRQGGDPKAGDSLSRR